MIGAAQLEFVGYPPITEDQYDAIEIGMTLEEVLHIVGQEGRLTHESVRDDYTERLKQYQAVMGEEETKKLKESLGAVLEPKKYEIYRYVGKFRLKPIYLIDRPEIRLEYINEKLVEKETNRQF
jgi:transcriptional antiterminator Rof (Rho-off)